MVKKGLFRRAQHVDSPMERRSLRERGAAMVEFALIAPLFFLVVFGGIEIGLMFRSYLALEDVTRTAGRVASIERNSADADAAILDQIARSVSPLQGDVQSVTIFNADSLDDEFDAEVGCVGPCNHFTIDEGDFATANQVVAGWDSSTRNEGDNIGIFIEFDYNYATGFFDTLTLSSSTIQVIEGNLN